MTEHAKYKCLDCGREFDDPATEYDHEYFWGAPCREYYDCCPYCGGDFEEIEGEEESEDDENGDDE